MRSKAVLLLLWVSSVTSLQLPKYSICSLRSSLITSARGIVTSPNYPNEYTSNLNCLWTVVSANGIGIRLTIVHLDNKENYDTGDGKCFDTLHIASVSLGGQSQDLHKDDELCANDVSELRKKVFDIKNSGKGVVQAQITFKTDYADHRTGFSIHFEALCNHTQTGNSGTITSPNYPQSYPHFSNCFTEIRAPYGTNIQINFEKLNVEVQTECVTDYVVISEGSPGLYGVRKKRYCSNDIEIVNVKSHIATLQFVSDGNLAYSGFSVNWRAVLPTTKPPTTTAASTTFETTTVIMKNCSYTNESILCQRWDATFPHEPRYTPTDKHHNFCRNPDGDQRGPWCYTTDPKKRWGYCDLDNCKEAPPTTIRGALITTQATTTDIETTSTVKTTPISVTSTSTVEAITGVFVDDPSPEKQTGDDESDGVPWFAFVIAGAALLVIIIFVLFFALRRKRRKTTVTINEPMTSDTVTFSQLERDDYGERPRENTYVEIPFLGEIHEDPPRRDAEQGVQDTCGKGFVHLNDGQSKNSSVSSLDSIHHAKEEAQRRFALNRGASTSSDANPYSVADELGESDAPPLPDEGTKGSLRVAIPPENDFDNIYHSIGAQQGNSFADMPLPPPPDREDTPFTKESSKKKSKDWKFMKKASKSELIPSTGFANPSYRETDDKNNVVRGEENPFDTDDEAAPTEASAYQMPSGLRLKDDIISENINDVYNAPSVIPFISDTNQSEVAEERKPLSKGSSPYMMPKIAMPSKVPDHTKMVCISPEMIDDKEQKDAFEDDFTLYSSPNPTSPVFELDYGENFTYDAPREARTATSFSSKSDSDSSQTESSKYSSTKSARDSGNVSLSAAESISDDKQEYCVMGSVSNLTKREKNSGSKDQNPAENRLSQLYLSMREIPNDRRVSEASWKSTQQQTSKPRKSV